MVAISGWVADKLIPGAFPVVITAPNACPNTCSCGTTSNLVP